MPIPIRYASFERSNHNMRLAYSNLLRFFNPQSNFVYTWYEILAGISIFLVLGLSAILSLYLVL